MRLKRVCRVTVGMVYATLGTDVHDQRSSEMPLPANDESVIEDPAEGPDVETGPGTPLTEQPDVETRPEGDESQPPEDARP